MGIQTDIAEGKLSIEDHFNTLIDQGWTVVEDYSTFRLGDRIRYTLQDDEFRIGGFVTSINPKDKWLQFIGHNKKRYSLQFEEIKKCLKKTTQDGLVRYKRPQKKTNFPVFIDDVPIYYGRSKEKQQRCLNSEKYRMAQEYGYKFIDD